MSTTESSLVGSKYKDIQRNSDPWQHPQQPKVATKVFQLGPRRWGLGTCGQAQDFYKLRDQCHDNNTRFEDPLFPADESSIFYGVGSQGRAAKKYEWLRPSEIVQNPQLFVEGATRFDIKQGYLGDCWILAAMANVTLHKKLFDKIVPEDQNFGKNYAGIFHFRIWHYGRWVDIVIDDRLPTVNGELQFLHSNEPNEFWSALFEKAYAKLIGSYKMLDGGLTSEAMENFTGGLSETFYLPENYYNLYRIMLKAFERSSLMCCSIVVDENSALEDKTPEGLVKGHAYSITNVKVIRNTKLIRLRNPWGDETEWNGPWSDESPECKALSKQEKKEMGLISEADGEFWMSYEDFMRNFSNLNICYLSPKRSSADGVHGSARKTWAKSMYEGMWVTGITAGGSLRYPNFWTNPQYRIILADPDDDDDDNTCAVIIALMQKNYCIKSKAGEKVSAIGFTVYHLSDIDTLPKRLGQDFFHEETAVYQPKEFKESYQVTRRLHLKPGVYCIIPSTENPNEDGEYILRVYSEHSNDLKLNDDELGWADNDETDHTLGSSTSRTQPMEKKEYEDEVKQLFVQHAGSDKEMDWTGLKSILEYQLKDEMTEEGFSKDVCRSLIAIMDVDHSGKLDFEEYKALLHDIMHWKGVFKTYEKNNKRLLYVSELRQALNSAGYRLNSHTLSILAQRYSTKSGEITFDDFIMCAVKLRAMINVFKEKDYSNNSTALFTKEEWIEKTVYM